MNCPNCNTEMEIDCQSGYMTKYRCTVCRRVETLWTVCIAGVTV
ncbi:MAG: hypothetical protein WC325_07420 [Candidatus Bathyarchaeia archaeon]